MQYLKSYCGSLCLGLTKFGGGGGARHFDFPFCLLAEDGEKGLFVRLHEVAEDGLPQVVILLEEILQAWVLVSLLKRVAIASLMLRVT